MRTKSHSAVSKSHKRNKSIEGKKTLSVGCLFSGMGGFASGLRNSGFEIRWANDNDEFACAAFRHRFPTVRMIEKDICDLSVQADRLASIDVLAAGFPCQSFSVAGKRQGFEDPRGALFYEIPRLIQEYESGDKPALIILENVPNLLYGANGSWFDHVRRSMRQAGYWFREQACWVVNVKDVTDLPQDRERLIMIAASRTIFSRNPFCPPYSSNGSEPETRPLADFVDRTKPSRDEAYLHPDNRYFKMINSAMDAGESDTNLYQLRRSYVREKKQGLCPTLTANMGLGGHNVPFIRDPWGIRRLSVREVSSLQGFDESDGLFPQIPVAEQYRLIGNSVCVGLARMVGEICLKILNDKDTIHG